LPVASACETVGNNSGAPFPSTGQDASASN
jgi:hypothetical protein